MKGSSASNLSKVNDLLRQPPPPLDYYRSRPPDPNREEGGSKPRRYVNGSPVFSILMPVRNGAETIERAIQSVIRQDYPNIEFLVCDGKSNDETVAILRKYEEYITYWFSEKDEGAQDAQNKVASLTGGDYATILLADDWLADDFVMATVNAFQSTGADFVFGDLEIYEGDRWLYHYRGKQRYDRTIAYEVSFTSPGWSFRSTLLKELGLLKLVDVAPDYDWVLRAHLAGKKGVYDGGINYHFLLGGNSTVKAILGYDEVRRIAVSQGGNRFVAYGYYLRAASRYRLRILLERLLPLGMITSLKRMVRRVLNSIS